MSELTSSSKTALQQWMRTDLKEAEPMFFYNSKGMVGPEGSGRPIVFKAPLDWKGGHTIRIPMDGLISGAGQGDNGRLDDNEESLTDYYDDVAVHERSHAVKAGGLFTQQISATDRPTRARRQMRMWVPRTVDADIRAAAHGLGNASADVANVNVRTPSSDRVMYIGQTTGDVELSDRGDDATLAAYTQASALFGPTCIERAARAAQEGDLYIEPIITEQGRPVYLMSIGLYQAKALLQSTKWKAAQTALTQFKGEESALFKGALGVWAVGHGYVIIHVDVRTPRRTNGQYFWNSGDTIATASRYIESAVLFGQNAIGFAQPKPWRYFRYYGDAGGSPEAMRHPRLGTDAVYGVACLRRTANDGTAGSDYGRIIVHTQVIPDS